MWRCTLVGMIAIAVVTGLIPRSFLVNDDEGLLAHLRVGSAAPFISPLLSEVLGRLYQWRPDVAWYGWWLYLLQGFALDVALRALWLKRHGQADNPRIDVVQVVASLAVVGFFIGLMATVTFTIAAMLACGVALVAATATVVSDAPQRGQTRWWLMVGALLMCGYMTRRYALYGAVIAVAPLGLWALWQLWPLTRRPPLRRVALLLAPLLLAWTVQDHVPSARHETTRNWQHYNIVRGSIHHYSAYQDLDKRAPELLAKAGWTRDDWHSFWKWLFLDEQRFNVERLQRVLDTGGKPPSWRETLPICLKTVRADGQLRKLGVTVVAIFALGLIGLFGARVMFFSAGTYLAFYALLYFLMILFRRFPYRIGQPILLLVAIGTWIIIRNSRKQVAGTPRAALKWPQLRPFRDHVLGLLLLGGVMAPFTFATWPGYLPDTVGQAEKRAFHQRVGERYDNGAYIFVYGSGGDVALDPLNATPRPYEYTGAGWNIFSIPFYRSLERLGVSRGADVFAAMVNAPQAFIVVDAWRTGALKRHFASLGKKWRLVQRDEQGKGKKRVVLLQIVED